MILHGDCLALLPTLAAESLDSVVTDPPYELGFMGKNWDRTGVAFRAGTWAAVLRVLKPGGYMVAFGAPRNYHRMACAIEDAGFEVRDCLMWVFGQGFPKSKALLKPAYEPIILARRPGPLQHLNIDECRVAGEPWKPHDATGLASRKFFTDGRAPVVHKEPHSLGRWPANLCHDGSDEVLAGFPETTSGTFSGHRNEPKTKNTFGNFDLRDEAGHIGDSGSAARFFYCSKAGKSDRIDRWYEEVLAEWISEQGQCRVTLLVDMEPSPPRVIGVSGSGESSEWSTFLFGSTLAALCRTASKCTIEAGTKSTTDSKIWNWLTRLPTSASTADAKCETASGGSPAESAESSCPSLSIILARTVCLPGASLAPSGTPLRLSALGKKAGHPTVKPLALMRWLVRLITPPGGTVLDPFAGSGTTLQAAREEGFDFIGIEREAEYIADIERRLSVPLVPQQLALAT